MDWSVHNTGLDQVQGESTETQVMRGAGGTLEQGCEAAFTEGQTHCEGPCRVLRTHCFCDSHSSATHLERGRNDSWA